MKGYNKQGQFFLLAAVIIAVVIINLGITANKATVNNEPEDFVDSTYNIHKEAIAVIDYEIYTNISDEEDLEDFIDKLAIDVKDKDPDSNFMFIYGNDALMKFKNFGSEDAIVEDEIVKGNGRIVISSICAPGGTCLNIPISIGYFNNSYGYTEITNLSGQNTFDIDIGEDTFTFPVSKQRQVIFIIQKEVEDENFVSVG